jgi:polyisoprenyl-phosphate glycosyltransferase
MIRSLAVEQKVERATAGRRVAGLVSVVVPMYNEEATAEAFFDRLEQALGGADWELIVVDDGSSDSTPEILAEAAASDSRIRTIRLSRNFGHQAALTAGLDHARGDAVVTIDADLQDPPEVIPELLAKWVQGASVVHAVRQRRSGEPRWRLGLISLFYRLFGRLARIESVGNSGDFRLLDRKALSVLNELPERNRFLRGLSVWIGFEQATVHYDRDARFAGDTKYPIRKLIELAFDGIASFSYLPLRFAAIVGMLVSVLALLAIPLVVIFKAVGEYVPGVASVTIVMLLLGGIQLMTIGVMGEYIGRSYDEVKRRPIYVISETSNIESGSAEDRAR